MTTLLLPELQQHLAHEADRFAPLAAAPAGPPQRRRLSGRPLWLAAGAALLISGGAYASRALWQPQIGDDRRGHGTISATEVPKAQGRLLGVLRREQTTEDRGAGTRATLKMLSPEIAQGVRTDSIRRLATTPDGEPIVLIPEATLPGAPGGSGDRFAERTRHNVLCLLVGVDHNSFGGTCQTTDAIQNGELSTATSRGTNHTNHYMVVVPDGVASVRFEAPGYSGQTVNVSDNFLQTDLPGAQFFDHTRNGTITWFDAAGRVVRKFKLAPPPAPPSGAPKAAAPRR